MRISLVIAAAALLVAQEVSAQSSDLQRANNTIKIIIGLNHLRCAEITYVTKVEGSIYGVTCIKRAGRKERVHYAVDAANNAVVSVR